MKLIIQIPCLNEAKTLPLVLKGIPKKIKGIIRIETLVIDDGSNDNTAKIAKQFKVDYIIRNKINRGLGIAFKQGANFALEKRVDILVNTDGDNQYPLKYIQDLIEPIIKKEADIVIADRQPAKVKHFSFIKRKLQAFGNYIVRSATGLDVPDAVCGFRAYSRKALLEINNTTDFSYVLDTLIQAAKKKLAIKYINVKINKPTRPSRLFKNILAHILHSAGNLLTVYISYEPLKVFFSLGLILAIIGLVPIIRFIYFFFTGQGSGHIQSLVIGTMLFLAGFQLVMIGLMGKILSIQRKLIEDILYWLKKDAGKPK